MTRHTQSEQQFNFTTVQVMGAIIVLVAAIAVPRLVTKARATPADSSDRAAVFATFRDIKDSETAYRSRNGEYADLLTLRNSGVLGERVTGVYQLKFRFSVQADDATHYFVTASPLLPASGSHFYYTDESGLNFESSSAVSAPNADSSGQAPDGFVAIAS